MPPVPRQSWASSPGRRRNMQANRSRDTKPELAVRRLTSPCWLQVPRRYRTRTRPPAEGRHRLHEGTRGCLHRRLLLARMPRTRSREVRTQRGLLVVEDRFERSERQGYHRAPPLCRLDCAAVLGARGSAVCRRPDLCGRDDGLLDPEVREVAQARVVERADDEPAVQESVELLAARLRKQCTSVARGEIAGIWPLPLLASVHADGVG